MSEIFYVFDLYAQPFPLRYKKEEKYKSKVGLIFGIFSLMSFIFFMIRGFLIIFYRKSFTIVEETKYLSHPKTNFSNIPFLLHLQNIDTGDDYTFNTSVFDISLTLMIYEYENNEIIFNQKQIPLIKCDNEKFLNLYSDFYDYNLINEYLCPDVNETIFLEGDFSDASIVKYLSFKIGVCSNDDCIEEIDSLIDRIKLVFYIQIHFPEYNNYSYPIHHYYKSFQISLSSSQSKDFSYYFISKTFISDNGYVINEDEKFYLFDYNIVENEILTFNNKFYLRGRFYADKKSIEIKRTYDKITLMLGEVGGTCGFIFTVCNRITAYFLRHIINEDIFNFIIFKNTQVKTKKIFSNSNMKNNIKNYQKFKEENSKKNMLQINNLYNYSNKRYVPKVLTYSKINLKWYHHLLPFEHCSSNKVYIKLNKHKDFVFRYISLEKIFEIDLLSNEINNINLKIGKIFDNYSTSLKSDTISNTDEISLLNDYKSIKTNEIKESNKFNTSSSYRNIKKVNNLNKNFSDFSSCSNFCLNNQKDPILKKINVN